MPIAYVQAQEAAEAADAANEHAQSATEFLTYVDSLHREDLAGINRFALTKDNAFLYAAPWRGNSLVGFKLREDGYPEHFKSFSNPLLMGVIYLDLNHDDSRLAGICLRSNTILLFKRDAHSGALVPDGFSRTDLTWPVSVVFAPDSSFLYVVDARASGASDDAESRIFVFEILTGGGLREVERLSHADLLGARNIIVDPAGQHCYVCCSTGGNIAVFSRDATTGKLNHLQTIRDDEDGPTLLDGVHSAALNADATRAYFISGRFRGDSGSTVFKRLEDGRLEFLSELAIDPLLFSGGNHLAVTKDESRIVASGTTGDSLAVIRQNLEANTLELESVLSNSPTQNLKGPSGISFDADERVLYVAAENGSSITIFHVNQLR